MAALRLKLAKFPQWREADNGITTDHFQPVLAKWVRMTILAADATSEGPALDEMRSGPLRKTIRHPSPWGYKATVAKPLEVCPET